MALNLLPVQAGSLRRARLVYTQLLQFDPGNAQATKGIAHIYLRNKQHGTAAALFQRAMKAQIDAAAKTLGPSADETNADADVLVGFGDALVGIHKPEHAAQAYAFALKKAGHGA